MKIAVISDIHGNMEALEAVMEDIKKAGCEKVFTLGDYAMAGPEPAIALDWVMSKAENPNYYMIQGNTDLMVRFMLGKVRKQGTTLVPYLILPMYSPKDQ